MPKLRISHFTLKDIPITTENSSSCTKDLIQKVDSQSLGTPVASKANIEDPNKPCLPRSSARRKEIIAASKEASYAAIPVRIHSKVIEGEIVKEAARFRNVSDNSQRK